MTNIENSEDRNEHKFVTLDELVRQMEELPPIVNAIAKTLGDAIGFDGNTQSIKSQITDGVMDHIQRQMKRNSEIIQNKSSEVV